MSVLLLGPAIAATALAWAAVSDLSRYIIPNGASAVIVAAYVLHVALAPDMPSWPGHVLAAILVFAVCATLFSAGLIGGGDAKLLPAVSLWAGLGALPQLLVVMGVAGGLLSLAVLGRDLARRRLPQPAGMPALPARGASPVPYGVAIAAGGVAVLFPLLSF